MKKEITKLRIFALIVVMILLGASWVVNKSENNTNNSSIYEKHPYNKY